MLPLQYDDIPKNYIDTLSYRDGIIKTDKYHFKNFNFMTSSKTKKCQFALVGSNFYKPVM